MKKSVCTTELLLEWKLVSKIANKEIPQNLLDKNMIFLSRLLKIYVLKFICVLLKFKHTDFFILMEIICQTPHFKGQMNQKIDIFSFVALPSPNTKKNHPK